MQVILNYTEEEKTSLKESFFQEVARETLKRCDIPSLVAKNEISINAISVSAEKIQQLNREYRNKDAVTDVLSFGEYDDTDGLVEETEENVFLGELFFCNSFIENAAKEDGIALKHEMAYIFSHGILHLLGYDHSEKMFAIQDTVTEYFITKRSE